MNKFSITSIIFSVVFFLTMAFLTTYAIAASIVSSHIHVINRNTLSKPFSGIVEGTVIATSTTSITIDKNIYLGRTASSTEMTFVLMPNVRVHEYHGESASTGISIGSSVSLVLEHLGKDEGKVFEIRVLWNGEHRNVFTHTGKKANTI